MTSSRRCATAPSGFREFLTPAHTFWSGALPETDFLARLYDLNDRPSHDSRYTTAGQDIVQHRVMNEDWDDDWIFSDPRFGLVDSDRALLMQARAGDQAEPRTSNSARSRARFGGSPASRRCVCATGNSPIRRLEHRAPARASIRREHGRHEPESRTATDGRATIVTDPIGCIERVVRSALHQAEKESCARVHAREPVEVVAP
jgi:hypothetical protein